MSQEAVSDSKQSTLPRVWAWAAVVTTGLLSFFAVMFWPQAAGMLTLAALALSVYLLAEAPLRRWRPETDTAPGWKFRPPLPRINGLIAAALIVVAAPVVLPWSGTGLAEWLRNAVLVAMIVVVVARPRSEMKAALALMAAALAGVTLSGLYPVAVLYLGQAVVSLGLITSGAFYFLRGHSFPGWLRPLGSPFAQGLTVVTGLGMVFGGLGAPHSVDAETFDTETLQTLRGSFPWLALLVLIRTAVAWSSISRAALGQRSQQPPEDAFPPITTPAAARAWSLNRQRLKQTIQQIETSPASKLAPAESGYLSERARAALAEVGRREDEARLTQAREELETLGRAIQDEYHLLDLPGEAQTVTRWPTSAPPESPPLAPSRQPCTDLDRREPTDQDT